MKRYVTIEKRVGETPLQAIEKYRATAGLESHIPLAYAGRLDPMASGTLLVLIGDECKVQTDYHSLDKAYRFEVLLGTQSDTGDVLGLLEFEDVRAFTRTEISAALADHTGTISLPYPHYSSKTVDGKPLHTWALEKRLNEIEIPIATTTIHSLSLHSLRSVVGSEVYTTALEKINALPPVTEISKALGRDFRRDEVRLAWGVWLEHNKDTRLQVVTIDCVCSSGTYMRSLAQSIGTTLGTKALALSIHRSTIGRFQTTPFGLGFWRKKY